MIPAIDRSSRLALMLILLLVSSSQAATYQEARAAYDRSEFMQAQSIWQALAEGGDVEAMFALGALLYEGPGEVPVNYLQSSAWYTKAANLGHADAQYNLGNAYQRGLGVWQDDLQAVHWWRKAAEQGLPKAAYNLGVQYAYGRGVPQNRDQALHWFGQAADRGHLQARQLLAELASEVDSTSVVQRRPQPVEPAPVSPSENPQLADESPAAPSPSPEVIGDAESIAARGMRASDTSEGEFDAGERRLLTAETASFTLQLTAMSSADRLKDYIRIHDLDDELIQFRFRAADRTLFGLSHGLYSTREAGQAALDQLQQRHAHQRGWQTPWLRPTDDLKILIRQVNETSRRKNG